jgi:uncharacterized protein
MENAVTQSMYLSWERATFGGILVGLAASLLLLTYGRVLGVSGIMNRLTEFKSGDTFWRILFFLGTAMGGYFASQIWPENFVNIRANDHYGRLALAGLIVGFGTKMGNGCTSGHGICGIGRLSAYFGEAGHLFRRKPVTCFGASRSAMLTPSERSDV